MVFAEDLGDSTFPLPLQPTTGQAFLKKSQVVSSWKPAGGLNHGGPASELTWSHHLTKTKLKSGVHSQSAIV